MKKTLALLLSLTLLLSLSACSMLKDIKENAERNAAREILETPAEADAPALFLDAVKNGFADALWDGYCGNVLTMPWLDRHSCHFYGSYSCQRQTRLRTSLCACRQCRSPCPRDVVGDGETHRWTTPVARASQ